MSVCEEAGYRTADKQDQPVLRGRRQKLMLLVPGRIGTSSPELGVPVVYADISQFAAICEVAYSKAGYRPELSCREPYVSGSGRGRHMLWSNQRKQ